MRSLAFIILCLTLSACGLRSGAKPSVLVIAVESLNSSLFFCGETEHEEYAGGLGVLCEEGVRFTHAFTPSTMSQASLASLSSALYPIDTGVVHNGTQYLNEKFVTVAESAVANGYRTAFFSGGAPIWSKSGLDQGFEIFEDNIKVTPKRPYRPAEESFNYFLTWLNEQVERQPFFSVIYLSDLQFTQYPTTDDAGKERALGRESQLREISESFAAVVAKLKSLKRWDNTYVIVTGLNGAAELNRENEISTTNLYSEGSQVLLMIKPIHKARDLGLNWSIDENVSLVDVGATLFDILNIKWPKRSSSIFEVVSLKSALDKPQVNWSKDRHILVESAWPNWRGVGSSRFSVRKNNLFYLFDVKDRLFNTLTDRFEKQPISSRDLVFQSEVEPIKNFFLENAISPWAGLPPTLAEKIRVFSAVIQTKPLARGEIKSRMLHLIRQRLWDKQLVGWLARLAVTDRDWTLLEELGRDHLNPIWVFIAHRMREEDIEPPADSCWNLLATSPEAKERRDIEVCEDVEFVAFVEAKRAVATSQKLSREERFIRRYLSMETAETLAALNFQNGLSWDVDVDIPAGPRLVQLALLLPENKYYRGLIEAAQRR